MTLQVVGRLLVILVLGNCPVEFASSEAAVEFETHLKTGSGAFAKRYLLLVLGDTGDSSIMASFSRRHAASTRPPPRTDFALV